MPPAFTHETITAALHSYWADQMPLLVTTIYPGTRVNTVNLNEWFELWIDTWSRRPQRANARKLLDLTVTVHCFVKPGLDKSRLHELADAVRSTLSQKNIPLRDYQTSGDPIAGYAKIFEPETRDLTRTHLNAQQHDLQHTVISHRGIAQET